MAKILIAEDDQKVADSVMFVLERNGHTVTHCLNEEAALKAFEDAEYDCLITDVWLGKDNGLDFLSKLRKTSSTIPCIVISGGGQGQTLENVTTRADILGAVRMLYKPFGDEELLESVMSAINSTA